MTHKDKDGGMQKNCRYGENCRSKDSCKDWHPRPARQAAAAKGKGGGKGGNVSAAGAEQTDMQKAKMAYAREERVALRTVDDSKVSGDMAQWLKKHNELQAKLQMRNMGRSGAVAMNAENNIVQLPAPGVFAMEWDQFAPREEERSPGGFNMSTDECFGEEKIEDKELLTLTRQRLQAMEDRRLKDGLAEEVTRTILTATGGEGKEERSSMKTFMAAAYGQSKNADGWSMGGRILGRGVAGCAVKRDSVNWSSGQKAIVQEEPQQMPLPAGYTGTVVGSDGEEDVMDEESGEEEDTEEHTAGEGAGGEGEGEDDSDPLICEQGMEEGTEHRCTCEAQMSVMDMDTGDVKVLCSGCNEGTCRCNPCERRTEAMHAANGRRRTERMRNETSAEGEQDGRV